MVITNIKHFYNIATDLITGINFRKKDNFFQLKFISIFTAIIVVLAYIWYFMYSEFLLATTFFGVALTSASIGVLVGMIISGAYLAIKKTIQHIKAIDF